jgi:methylated-DNA-protein-cysteine methyltransferase-like protein
MPRPPARENAAADSEENRSAVEMARFRARVVRLVALIPRGRVATYGQISLLAGHPRRARHVGNVLRHNRDPALPWHRVLNAQGRVSARAGETRPRGDVRVEHRQQRLLAAEGVTFTRGRVPLERYRWRPEEEGATLLRGLRGKR